MFIQILKTPTVGKIFADIFAPPKFSPPDSTFPPIDCHVDLQAFDEHTNMRNKRVGRNSTCTALPRLALKNKTVTSPNTPSGSAPGSKYSISKPLSIYTPPLLTPIPSQLPCIQPMHCSTLRHHGTVHDGMEYVLVDNKVDDKVCIDSGVWENDFELVEDCPSP